MIREAENGRRGQVWVETVIYTLIGLAIMGIVLAILTPRIREYRDRNVIEQSIQSLEAIDSKVQEVLDAPGNKRRVYLTIERGRLVVDPVNDELIFIVSDSHTPYSEPGVEVQVGRLKVETTAVAQFYDVRLTLPYPKYDITINEGVGTGTLELGLAATPHNLFIEHRGFTDSQNPPVYPIIDFSSS
jgi:type II secretory pathway pseudopilin PulG